MKTPAFCETKNTFAVALCFLLITAIRAQSPFSISPSSTITSSIDCDSIKELHFYIVNANAHDIALEWKVISNTLPKGNDVSSGTGGCWDYMLCDWEFCISQIPSIDSVISRTPIVANTNNNDMKLAVMPGKINGSGSLVIEIFEASNPINSKTVTWNVTGCTTGNMCTANILETADNNRFTVYPNPAEDFITIGLIKGNSKSIGSVQIYNLVGEILLEFNGIKSNTLKIDVSKLPAGAYFIKCNNTDRISVKNFFKVK